MPRKASPRKSKKRTATPVFDSIRKPNAPPGHPLSRAKPDEVARLIAFLATAESGVMTGALIDFDQQVMGLHTPPRGLTKT